MSEKLNYRKESRKQYLTAEPQNGLTMEQLNMGALLRIADATEAMAKRHTDLIDENERLKESVNYWREKAQEAERSIPALKGHITRLRNKLKNANQ
ncbi:hypothetical protein [Roseivirga seohaensis]|uniref:hypothetical protein n=1 Tax=Roseivirga seohaensis TaxID=1914963 RepID=UPI003BABDFE2